MTLPEALELLEYWRDSPPENEMLQMLAQVYTTWRPQAMTAGDHQRSLEERWRAGAMNAKQLVEAFGGTAAMRMDGTAAPASAVGGFPWETRH